MDCDNSRRPPASTTNRPTPVSKMLPSSSNESQSGRKPDEIALMSTPTRNSENNKKYDGVHSTDKTAKNTPKKSILSKQSNNSQQTSGNEKSYSNLKDSASDKPLKSDSNNKTAKFQAKSDANKTGGTTAANKTGGTTAASSSSGASNKGSKAVVKTQPTAQKSVKDVGISIPDTNCAVGLLVCFCFNPPIGVAALYFSLRSAAAYRDGFKEKGAARARTSIYLSLIGITLTMIIVTSLICYNSVMRHHIKKETPVHKNALGF